MSEASDKRSLQKLQRAIVNGLEDIRAKDILVFDTTHLSPLFERVIIASGTSNRQTRALAVSVRDKVRAAGFDKPREEGADTGEWIIVDCGAAVVHVMQPAIRDYYRLEEIWGEKPVRMRLAEPAEPTSAPRKRAPAARKRTPASVTKGRTRSASSATRRAPEPD